MRGRIRLVSPELRGNKACGADLQMLAANHPEVACLRVNLLAGSLLLEHVGLTHWRRRTVQALLDDLNSEPNSEPPTPPQPNGALLRLSLTGLLLLAQISLPPAWLWLVALGVVPPLLLPLLRELRNEWGSGELPRETLGLAWHTTLILRGELGTMATELAMENGSQMLQGSIDHGGSYGALFTEKLQSWLEEARFPLDDGDVPPKPISLLQRGDCIRLIPGDVVPLDGDVVAGEAVVSKHLLDGRTALTSVHPLQALPVGAVLVEGSLVLKLNRELSEQSIYAELLELNSQTRTPWGIERARRAHQRLMPLLLGGGAISLLLGHPNQAASLMQFDPINDWQLSASVAYRGANNLCQSWGVRLRHGAVLDRLCHCRTLVISEGAICFGIKRDLLDIKSVHIDYSPDALLEIVAGFWRLQQPDAFPLFPLQPLLIERNLKPRALEDVRPAGASGLRGRLNGKQIWVGGGDLLQHLGIQRPAEMLQRRGLHWTFVLVEREVVGGILFHDHLKRDVSRGLKRLHRHGWKLHLVSTWHGDILHSIARQLKLSPACVHPCVNLSQRTMLIRELDRSNGPVAYLGSALMDSGAFAEADIALAVSDGTISLPAEMADIVLPAQRLDRLVDCVTVAEDIGANNRFNFYLTLLPHSSALLLSIVVSLDPLIAVLLADLPMLLVELKNLQTYNHLRTHHHLGWRAQRKRASKRRSSHRRIPEPKQNSGDGVNECTAEASGALAEPDQPAFAASAT
jgi:Cu2+-exporting ATPase